MKERIFKSWRTSLLGAGLIVAALGAVYIGRATLTEAALVLPVAFTLIFIKDPAKYLEK
jgi:hypothetical protein